MAKQEPKGAIVFKGKKAQGIKLYANGATQQQVADAVGVHYHTVANWMKDPVFQKAVLDTSYGLLKQKLPIIYTRMFDEAAKGSHQHLKILMDHLARMEDLANGYQSSEISFTWKRKESE